MDPVREHSGAYGWASITLYTMVHGAPGVKRKITPSFRLLRCWHVCPSPATEQLIQVHGDVPACFNGMKDVVSDHLWRVAEKPAISRSKELVMAQQNR